VHEPRRSDELPARLGPRVLRESELTREGRNTAPPSRFAFRPGWPHSFGGHGSAGGLSQVKHRSEALGARQVGLPPSGLKPAEHMAGVGLIGGLALGILFGGIGGRAAMRIIFLTDPESGGAPLAGDFHAGTITMDGTFIVVMTGAVLGVAGGLLYVVVRRWLPGSPAWRGVVYGLFLVVICSGGPLFRGDTLEPRTFEPPLLSITLFASLIFLYGLSLPLVIDRFDTHVPAVLRRATVSAVGYIVLAGLTIFGLVLTVSAVTRVL
jgi:hypothetical protein